MAEPSLEELMAEAVAIKKRIALLQKEEQSIKEDERAHQVDAALETVATKQTRLKHIRAAREAADERIAMLRAEVAALDELVDPVPVREAVARHLQGSVLAGELQRHQVRPELDEDQSSATVLADVIARRAKAHEERMRARQQELDALRLQQARLDSSLTSAQAQQRPSKSMEPVGRVVTGTDEQLRQRLAAIEKQQRELKDMKSRANKPYEGQLGLQSYEPWQHANVLFVRGLVWQIVNTMLEYVDFTVEDTSALAAQKQEWESHEHELMNEIRAAQLDADTLAVYAAIENDVIGRMVGEIWTELLATQRLIDFYTVSAIIGKEAGPDGNRKRALVQGLLTQARRAGRGKDYVAHTLPMKAIGGRGEQQRVVTVADAAAIDISTLSLTPNALRAMEELEPALQACTLVENAIWARAVKPTPVPDYRLPATVTAMSLGQSHLALGLESGSVLVYHLVATTPASEQLTVGPIHTLTRRVVEKAVPGWQAIARLGWSADELRLVVSDAKGALVVWSLLASGQGSPDDLLLSMSATDFSFIRGPLADSSDFVAPIAKIAVFFPSFDLLGAQNSIVVGLHTGDVLRVGSSRGTVPAPVPTLDMRHVVGGSTRLGGSDATAPRVTLSDVGAILDNTASGEGLGSDGAGSSEAPEGGQGRRGLGAELFRAHRSPIIAICFVNNMLPMVTLDEAGYLFYWHYAASQLTSFGWFVPLQQYRVRCETTVFRPMPSMPPKVLFLDEKRLQKHGQTAFEAGQQRRAWTKRIEELKLGQPWHVTKDQDGFTTNVYMPSRDALQAGEPFHVVRLRPDGSLASYATQLYRGEPHPALKLLASASGPAGSDLAILGLLPECAPKGPIVTMTSLRLAENGVALNAHAGRTDFDLTPAEFNRLKSQTGLASICLTPVLPGYHTDYALVSLFGKTSVVSLTTGLRAPAPLDESVVSLIPDSRGAVLLSGAGRVVKAAAWPCPLTTTDTPRQVAAGAVLPSALMAAAMRTLLVQLVKDVVATVETRALSRPPPLPRL
eukprot:m.48561 g.48561  ORF g.48561 m.48561 type:complete len:1018 (-) comp11390_c0_seq2:32-3085(-)